MHFHVFSSPTPDCSKPITLLIILFNSQPISMKPILSLFAAFALAGQLTAQTVSGMNELSAEQKAAATELKLTGKLSVKGNSDFRQLRDLCWQLRNVDLSVADCEAVPKTHSTRAVPCSK